MKHFEPTVTDPFLWQKLFVESLYKIESDKRIAELEKKKRELNEKLKYLKDDLDKNREKEQLFKRNGTLLRYNIHLFNTSDRCDSLKLCDIDGRECEIKLDPRVSISENMVLFFEKSKKYSRGSERITAFIEDCEKELNLLDQGHLSETSPLPLEKKDKKESGEHKPYHQFRTKKGKLFLVGKSSLDNDILTFKISSPHDLWFHVVDMGGSHVIFKKEKNYQPTEEDIFLGCALALFYSKAKKGMQGEVWYTERKFILKKKGMAPGKVLITKGKTKYLRCDESFLEKLVKE